MATTKVAIVRDKRRSSSWAVRWYGVLNIDNGRVVRYSQAFRKRADAVRFHAEKQGENGVGGTRTLLARLRRIYRATGHRTTDATRRRSAQTAATRTTPTGIRTAKRSAANPRRCVSQATARLRGGASHPAMARVG